MRFYQTLTQPISQRKRNGATGFISNSATISGNTLVFSSTTVYPLVTASYDGTGAWPENFMTAVAVVAIGGADTVLTTCAINGQLARVDCQCNTGGYIAAVVSFPGSLFQNSGSNIRVVINTTGTAPTSGSADYFSNIGIASDNVFSVGTSTTATDTARTVSVNWMKSGFLVAASINDVGTANSCTWTGTAGPAETTDAAIGTGRRSTANLNIAAGASLADNAALTVISTYVVASTLGNSLAVAAYR